MLMDSNSKLIELTNVTVGYDSPVVSNVNLEIHHGDYWGIIGPNGAGKTTLFKTILGLTSPLEGYIAVKLPENSRIAYVPQRHTLMTELPISVKDVILMPVRSNWPFIKPSAEHLDRMHHYAEMLDMSQFLNNDLTELSGGQRQKTLICRALMMQSNVMLLDEPTNGMDVASEQEILNIIRMLNRDKGYTILFISHIIGNLLNEASSFALIDSNKMIRVTRNEILSGQHLEAIFKRQVKVVKMEDKYYFDIRTHYR